MARKEHTFMSFNDRIISEFRSNNGIVNSAGFGSALVLIHSTGAKTGKIRVNPAMSLRDGDAWLVVASAMGAQRNPAWALNLRAEPRVEIEASVAGALTTILVTAEELDGPAYADAFARFVRRAPAFQEYQNRATRRLPVFRFSPR